MMMNTTLEQLRGLKLNGMAAGLQEQLTQAGPPCQTRCRPIMIAEDPHRSTIYEQKFTFN